MEGVLYQIGVQGDDFFVRVEKGESLSFCCLGREWENGGGRVGGIED